MTHICSYCMKGILIPAILQAIFVQSLFKTDLHSEQHRSNASHLPLCLIQM